MKYEHGVDLDKLRQIEAQVTEIRLHLQRAEKQYIELRLRRAEARLAELRRLLHALYERGQNSFIDDGWESQEQWRLGSEIALMAADIMAMKEKM